MSELDLPAEILGRAAQVNSRPHTRLMYAEDVLPGVELIVEKPCDTPFAGMLSHEEHNHGVERYIVDEIRTAGDMVSIRAVDEAGKQKGIGCHRLTLLPAAEEIPRPE